MSNKAYIVAWPEGKPVVESFGSDEEMIEWVQDRLDTEPDMYFLGFSTDGKWIACEAEIEAVNKRAAEMWDEMFNGDIPMPVTSFGELEGVTALKKREDDK